MAGFWRRWLGIEPEEWPQLQMESQVVESVECEKCHIVFAPHGLEDFPANWCPSDINLARAKRAQRKAAFDKRQAARRLAEQQGRRH